MKKKNLLSVFLIAFVLVFAACDKDDDTTPETTEETTEEENNTEEENTKEENTEEENTEENNTEEEENTEEETSSTSYTKAQLTGSWSLQNAQSDDLCEGKKEVFTFKEGDNNAYLSCDNDPDPFAFPYTLSDDVIVMDMDFLGKPNYTIDQLDETTLKITFNNYTTTYLKEN